MEHTHTLARAGPAGTQIHHAMELYQKQGLARRSRNRHEVVTKWSRDLPRGHHSAPMYRGRVRDVDIRTHARARARAHPHARTHAHTHTHTHTHGRRGGRIRDMDDERRAEEVRMEADYKQVPSLISVCGADGGLHPHHRHRMDVCGAHGGRL